MQYSSPVSSIPRCPPARTGRPGFPCVGRTLFGVLSMCLLAVPQAFAQLAPEVDSGVQAKRLVLAQQELAVTAHPSASAVAAGILARGGSAVDAAIAAQLVLNLVEPQSSGIGGGGFMLVFNAKSIRLRALDGRETAPAGVKPDHFLKETGGQLAFLDAVDSGLSVGVPGLLHMLDMAHRGHGRLPWPELFQPAVRLAREGFPISPRLHASISAASARLARSPAAAAYFLEPDGTPKAVGTILRNPEFAAVLEEVASQGIEAFYKGPTARAITEAVNADPRRPGVMTLKDLAGYRALEREPLCGEYRAIRVCGMPPPSSGGLTTLQTLKMLETADMAAFAPGSLDAVHLISEAFRLAYADRAKYIADPAYASVPVEGLLATDYAQQRAALIELDRSLGAAPAGTPAGAPQAAAGDEVSLPSTTHLSIVDREGNAVAMTTSIENAFGNLTMVRGFLLNNQLTDFSFRFADDDGRLVANRIEPGKRPRSSMAPTFVFDPDWRLAGLLGSPGGSSIIHYVTNTLVGMIDWRLDAQQAIDMPHFGATTSPLTTLEAGTALAALEAGLRERGHDIRLRPLTSGLHAIVANDVRPDGKPASLAIGERRSRWAGAADPRREGVAVGW